MSRAEAVVTFDVRPPPGPLKRVVDILQALFGKVTSLAVITLLASEAGHTVTNAAGGAGTALTVTRTTLDLEDAGVDSVRLVVRGQNSGAGSVTVQAYNVTTSAALASVTVTDAVEQTADSGWTVVAPAGGDEQVEIRVIGDGALDPVLYSAHLHLRTVQARA
jgi:hypothetical protein